MTALLKIVTNIRNRNGEDPLLTFHYSQVLKTWLCQVIHGCNITYKFDLEFIDGEVHLNYNSVINSPFKLSMQMV